MRVATFLRSLAAATALLAGAQAQAAFHLFTINEVYTNASGTLQFVEMTALAGGQQFTAGHTLVSTADFTTKTIPLATNLPGDTSGRRVLFATVAVFTEMGVLPDYIIPDGFLSANGGILNWGEGSDILTYPALPTDGINSYSRNGAIVTATPQNFAGVIGAPRSATTPAYQGMWWASPAGSESGWGINTAHQGDTLFATWFTYDADGNGLWMILSNAAKIGEGRYGGDIFTVRGPPFNAVPFDSTQVVATPVGSGTFVFASPTSGTFVYTVNGITQTKTIVRYEFGTQIPNCTAGGTPTTPINYQDIWWRSPGGSESGWGLNVVHQGDQLFLSWFTYDATGKGQWLVMPDVRRTVGDTFTGGIFRVRGNPFNSTPWNVNSVVSTNVGTVTLAFTDRNSGTFTYTLDGIMQSKAITRTVFNPSGTQTVCNYP